MVAVMVKAVAMAIIKICTQQKYRIIKKLPFLQKDSFFIDVKLKA